MRGHDPQAGDICEKGIRDQIGRSKAPSLIRPRRARRGTAHGPKGFSPEGVRRFPATTGTCDRRLPKERPSRERTGTSTPRRPQTTSRRSWQHRPVQSDLVLDKRRHYRIDKPEPNHVEQHGDEAEHDRSGEGAPGHADRVVIMASCSGTQSRCTRTCSGSINAVTSPILRQDVITGRAP
jgi:hypothetical protein